MDARLLVALLVLAAPIAASAQDWGTYGYWEPDTKQDRLGLWMWTGPPPVGETRIYFNAMVYASRYFIESANPGSLPTNVPRALSYVAILGAWTDCNGDGYIGLGERGLIEYSAASLTSAAACPPVTGPDPPPAGWTPAHNYNGWVHEYLPLGPTDVVPDANGDGSNQDEARERFPRAIHDAGARVWGDFDLPSGEPGKTTSGRDRTNVTFFFTPHAFALPAPARSVVGGGAPPDGGVGALRPHTLVPGWLGRVTPPDLPVGTREVWATFYAHVGADTIARGYAVPFGSSVYGGPCSGTSTGVREGILCDETQWWPPRPDGTPTMPMESYGVGDPRPQRAVGARVHDEYELRDVDCIEVAALRGRSAEKHADAAIEVPCGRYRALFVYDPGDDDAAEFLRTAQRVAVALVRGGWDPAGIRIQPIADSTDDAVSRQRLRETLLATWGSDEDQEEVALRVLYVIGHGGQGGSDVSPADEDDGEEEVISSLPIDDGVTTVLAPFEGPILLFVDTCSGAGLWDGTKDPGSLGNVAGLAAASADGNAYSKLYLTGWMHRMSKFVVDGLEGEADDGGDHSLDVHELVDYVVNEPQVAQQQQMTPFRVGRFDEVGELPFAVPAGGVKGLGSDDAILDRIACADL